MKINSSGFQTENFRFPSFEINIEGQIKKVGVFGRNGAGKTTMFKIIQGSLGSEISLEDVKNKRVEFIPQFFSVSNQFIRTYDFIIDVFDLSGVNLVEVDFSYISDLIEKKLGVLSGGEVKRLLFWIVEQKKSSVVLLDEVFANLDPRMELEIEERINRLSQEDYLSVILLSSHRKEILLKNCDWFIGIKNCEIAFSGDKDRFLTSGIFEELHEI